MTRSRESPLLTPEEHLALERNSERYRRLPSLEEYLLVAQDHPHLERYRRHGEGLWLFDESDGLEAEVVLGSIDCTLALRDVNEQVLDARDSSPPQPPGPGRP